MRDMLACTHSAFSGTNNNNNNNNNYTTLRFNYTSNNKKSRSNPKTFAVAAYNAYSF